MLWAIVRKLIPHPKHTVVVVGNAFPSKSTSTSPISGASSSHAGRILALIKSHVGPEHVYMIDEHRLVIAIGITIVAVHAIIARRS